MSPSPATPVNDQQRATYIREQVNAFRQRYPILRHQDTLGAGIQACALAGMLGSSALYVSRYLAWWACCSTRSSASLTHELEHDLIHCMHFRKQRMPHNLMMTLVCPSAINPWMRQHLHLNHHKDSGSRRPLPTASLGGWRQHETAERSRQQTHPA